MMPRQSFTTFHRQTDAQPSLQTTATLEANPLHTPSSSTLILFLRVMILDMETALWPVQVDCPSHVLPISCQPQPICCRCRAGKRESLDPVQDGSSQNIDVLSVLI